MYSVADMLIKIKNAQAVKKKTASFPFSNFRYNLCKTLKDKGFIEEVKKRGRYKKMIVIGLSYKEGESKIHDIKIISRPGQRIYLRKKKLYFPKKGYGTLIVSTPKGLMTSEEAKKMNLGGEVICEIW